MVSKRMNAKERAAKRQKTMLEEHLQIHEDRLEVAKDFVQFQESLHEFLEQQGEANTVECPWDIVDYYINLNGKVWDAIEEALNEGKKRVKQERNIIAKIKSKLEPLG